ncbi:MAG: hypothetical protein ABFD66_04470 [Smithella sp.]
MTDAITQLAGFARIFLDLAFLMFIPGFAISLVFFPFLSDIPIFERLIFSGIASIGTAMVAVLFLDVALGIESGPGNALLILIIITVAVLLLWRIECVFLKKFRITASSIPLQIRIYHESQHIFHNALDMVKKFSQRIISRIGK